LPLATATFLVPSSLGLSAIPSRRLLQWWTWDEQGHQLIIYQTLIKDPRSATRKTHVPLVSAQKAWMLAAPAPPGRPSVAKWVSLWNSTRSVLRARRRREPSPTPSLFSVGGENGGNRERIYRTTPIGSSPHILH
jgi:hypothetical protein